MIGIIDYGIGNLGSIRNALDKLQMPSVITSDADDIRKVQGLILPGVGAAGAGMENLRKTGLDKLIKSETSNGKPFLGICLGMQLLFDQSEEGNVKCLGILKGRVRKFKIERKVPQIGWNQVKYKKSNIRDQKYKLNTENIFNGVSNNNYFYFVNSYYCEPEDKSIIAGETEYGENFASIIIKDNIFATQFHPEKSGDTGKQLLMNWCKTLR